jgi:hypothetical protein
MSVYAYEGAPPKTYNELLTAESKGRYINLHIKPAYRHEEVTACLEELSLPP